MVFDPSFKCPMYLATLKSCDTMKQSVYEWQYIRSPSQGLSSLGKELTAATCIMQSSSNELSTLVSSKAKCKQTKATT